MPLDPKKPIYHKVNKALLNQLRFMETHAQNWLEGFDCIQTVTENAIPIRLTNASRQDLFKLHRGENPEIANTQRERQIEQSLWRQWCCRPRKEPNNCFLPGVLRGFVSYQVPLRQGQADKQRAADLIGVTPQGLPAVVELKKESGDVPLWALAEAYGYALAIRKNWNAENGTFRRQWETFAPKTPTEGLPEKLKSIPVLIAAPEAYWLQRVGTGHKRESGELRREQWVAFHVLSQRLAAAGFPVTAVAFDVEYNSNLLPLIHHPRVRTLPAGSGTD